VSRPEIIFAFGLQKTGLGSLAIMFEKAGYCRTRSRLASRERKRILREITAEKQPNLDVYFADDTLFIDWPAPLLYRQAYQKFGDRARYILSLRSSPDKWIDSLKTHSLTFQPRHGKHQIIYGSKYPQGRENEHIDYYNEHNELARNFFSSQNAGGLFCEVLIEDTSSVQNMLSFLNLQDFDLAHEHANTGQARLQKFSIRKKYNNFVLKVDQYLRNIARN
jgi:hypothetical protein